MTDEKSTKDDGQSKGRFAPTCGQATDRGGEGEKVAALGSASEGDRKGSPTVEDALSAWFAGKKFRDMHERDFYQHKIRNLCMVIGHVRIDELSTGIVRTFVADSQRKGRSSAVISLHLTVLDEICRETAIFGQLVELRRKLRDGETIEDPAALGFLTQAAQVPVCQLGNASADSRCRPMSSCQASR